MIIWGVFQRQMHRKIFLSFKHYICLVLFGVEGGSNVYFSSKGAIVGGPMESGLETDW